MSASNGAGRVCRTCGLRIRWVAEREMWVHAETGKVEGRRPAPPPGGWAPRIAPAEVTAYLVHEARPANQSPTA